ncbi:MAG: outer membrane beta-barrel protein [Dysgonamonadaceae bacterium]|jgi:hypothetical protein|nr:outer membrane beta-barrel protein [Dysgonamonadaceae bacterium]
MKDNIDQIKQQIQSKFSDFEVPLPQDGWLRIENTLDKMSEPALIRRRLWYWYSGVAAAIAALVVGGFFLFRQPTLNTNIADLSPVSAPSSLSTETEKIAPVPEKEEPTAIKNQQNIPAQQQVRLRQEAQAEKTVESVPQTDEKAILPTPEERREAANSATDDKPLIAEEKEKKDAKTEDRQAGNASSQKLDEAEQKRLIEEFFNAGKRDLFAQSDAKPKKSRKRGELAFNGKGGLSSYQSISNAPMMLRSADTQSDMPSDMPNGQLAMTSLENLSSSQTLADVSSNTSEKQHSQPVSFGITVSRNINGRFSIETGLIYTYLHSQTKNTAQSAKNEDSQYFHYLGIPVNVNYSFASFGKLDIYGTVGGSIEKDLYGEAKYFDEAQSEIMNSSSERQISKKIKQENPQISINTGIGVSYPLNHYLRLYGKIGGSYYFDAKNEYPTIYSDKKILLDMNAGLKFEF